MSFYTYSYFFGQRFFLKVVEELTKTCEFQDSQMVLSSFYLVLIMVT